MHRSTGIVGHSSGHVIGGGIWLTGSGLLSLILVGVVVGWLVGRHLLAIREPRRASRHRRGPQAIFLLLGAIAAPVGLIVTAIVSSVVFRASGMDTLGNGGLLFGVLSVAVTVLAASAFVWVSTRFTVTASR
jgi:hydrogenase-4 membrane subunit HyfE